MSFRLPILVLLAFSAVIGKAVAQTPAVEPVCAGAVTRVAGLSVPACLPPLAAFTDCASCPPMVVVPAGSFAMGSSSGEAAARADETPQHTVVIGRAFAIGQHEVTRAEFAAYAREDRDYKPEWCWVRAAAGEWVDRTGSTYLDPGFPQEDSHPVVCVTWYDAKAYVAWLSRKTGYPYRLLSEAEWEYAARAGTTTPYSFGANAGEVCRFANSSVAGPDSETPAGKAGCTDRFAYTAPVGSFAANPFGLLDMAGNAAEWVEDCYHPGYAGAPTDSSAWTFGTCASGQVIRGGSWNDEADGLRSAARNWAAADDRYSLLGFRVARTLLP